MSPVPSFYLIGLAALLIGSLAAWRSRSVELRDRTVTLLVLLHVVALTLAVSDASWRSFCVVLGVLALLEMVRSVGGHSYVLLLLLASLVLGVAQVESLADHWPFGLAGVLSIGLWTVVGVGRGVVRVAYLIAWGVGLLVPAVVMLVGLRSVSVDWVVLLFLATQANDMLGLMAGKFFGRRPLLPRISPNKTVEGFVAGGLGVVIAGVAARLTCPEFARLSWAASATILVVLFLAANAGDLLFSRVKRCFGLKDFGSLLPGHGGVLDRVDSLLLAAPALYACLALLEVA